MTRGFRGHLLAHSIAVHVGLAVERRICTHCPSDPAVDALVENAPDGIVVSRDGIILYANRAAAALLAAPSCPVTTPVAGRSSYGSALFLGKATGRSVATI
jgi:hypothetical protein